MTVSATDDITISFADGNIPVGTLNFQLPLIVGQSDESGTPDDVVNKYNNMVELTNDFSRTDSPRITDFAEEIFRQGAGQVAILNVSGRTPSSGELSTALDNVEGEDFFYVCMTSREGTAGTDPQGVSGDRSDVSTWCNDNDRIFLTTNNIGESVSDMENDLNNNLQDDSTYFLAFEDSADSLDTLDHPVDAGMAGIASSEFPGSINFKFQNIDDVPASDFTNSEATTLEGANGNVYLDKLGVAQTSGGVTPTGRFIDITIIEIWLKKQITASFIGLAVNNEKIPYEASGFEQVKGILEDVFEEAVAEDLIGEDENGVPQFSIDIPEPSEVSQSDRDNRILPDILINATLSGAVNEAEVTIRLQA